MTKKELQVFEKEYKWMYTRYLFVKDCSAHGIRGWREQDAKILYENVCGMSDIMELMLRCTHSELWASNYILELEEEAKKEYTPITEKEAREWKEKHAIA